MSTAETPAGPDVPPPARTSTRKWIAGAAAAVAVVAVAVAAFAIARDDDNGDASSSAMDSQRVAATQRACRQWLDDYSSSSGDTPEVGWCDDLTQWMDDQMATGNMMGPMMWDSPQAMIDACRQWTTTARGNGTTATSGPTTATGWCDQMVGWMSQHMGDWDDREDWDDHMDDGHWNGMMDQ